MLRASLRRRPPGAPPGSGRDGDGDAADEEAQYRSRLDCFERHGAVDEEQGLGWPGEVLLELVRTGVDTMALVAAWQRCWLRIPGRCRAEQHR